MENAMILDMKKRSNIFDNLVWVCIAWIVLWLGLKVSGLMHTPLILEYSPAFAAVYVAGRAIQKLNHVDDTVRRIGIDFKRVEQDFRKLETEHTLLTSKKKKH